jgi:gluconate 2-dehydrogenase alpha chain
LLVGSGAGGSAAAEMLCRHGKKVLILEAGSNYFMGLDDPDPGQLGTVFSNDELKMGARRFVMPDPLVDPRTFRREESDGVRLSVGEVNALPKTVGGGSVIADLKTPRFWPGDFHLGELAEKYHGTSFANWPVDYDELEPFYYHCEKTMGVQGKDGMSPFDPPRPSGPFPMPPGAPMYMGLMLSRAAESLGYHPMPYPGAVNSRPYDGRMPCMDCGYCVGYGCEMSARGTPAVTFLRRALLSGNCTLLAETKVLRLRYTGRRITGVEVIGPDGKRAEHKAAQYILAASPIENARLLLLSGPGLGNSSGLVGRNLMFHHFTAVAGVFSERLHSHRGRTVTHGLMDFRGKPNDIHARPLGGIVEFGAAPFPIEEASLYYKNFSILGNVFGDGRYLTGKRLKTLMGESPLRDRLAAALMHGEDAPQYANRVDLDPEIKDLDGIPVPRITYKSHAFELSAGDYYKPKLMELLRAAGADYVFYDSRGLAPETRHIMGTLRFGDDPRSSVCDRRGRFHDLDNLYAADGSLFPTSSGFNPTLTICALSSFVGACMVAGDSPQRALAAAAHGAVTDSQS